MTLPVGIYRTAAGSEMRVSGNHAGTSEVLFDWFEEPDACLDCVVAAYDEDGRMCWNCDECGGGSAELFPVNSVSTEE